MQPPDGISEPDPVSRCNIWDEGRTIANRIEGAIADGARPDEFAVLCPSKAIAKILAGELAKRKLPFVLADGEAKRRIFNGAPTIKVMTIHSSKGLEFDTVFIPGVCEMAGYRASSEESMLGGAKLLYVGMTRALGRLIMLHHNAGPIPARLDAAIREVRDRLAA